MYAHVNKWTTTAKKDNDIKGDNVCSLVICTSYDPYRQNNCKCRSPKVKASIECCQMGMEFKITGMERKRKRLLKSWGDRSWDFVVILKDWVLSGLAEWLKC
jgi:hypothetical protein